MRSRHHVRTIPTVLKNVLDNPRVGRYVKKLHIGTLFDGSRHHTNHVEEGLSFEEEEDNLEDYIVRTDMFTRAACQSHYLDTARFTECDWDSFIGIGDEELLLVLLLTELPNLDTFSFKWDPSADWSWLDQLMQRVPTAAIPILSNLRVVHLEPGARGIDFDQLPLFSALPSLQLLSAPSVWDFSGSCDHNQLSIQHSNVTHLAMPRSTVGSKSMHEYLLSFPLLHTFEYEQAVPGEGFESLDPFDPFLLRSALLLQARTSLQKLSITGPLSQESFIGSLVGFETLREVHTNFSFLIPLEISLEEIQRWPSRILPASLRILKLRDEYGREPEQYVNLVDGLARAKGTTCPLLEAFELAAPRLAEIPDLHRICEGAGIAFAFVSSGEI